MIDVRDDDFEDDFDESNIAQDEKPAVKKAPSRSASRRKAPPRKVATVKSAAEPGADERVKIILEEGEHIPPTGQYFGLNGTGYIIRPGEPVSIPRALLNVIHDVITSIPVRDNANNVIGYRDKLRFPYRLVA